jgi:ATP-dependent 26S proteasome regulatory subunit
MPKQIDNAEIAKKLEKAQSIREDAEKRAKEIESGILDELKEQKKSLLEQVEQLDSKIEKISGKPVATGEKRKRIDSEPTILAIVKERGQVSCVAIETDPKMIALYSPREVSAQAIKLKSLLEEKKLKKTGERKKAVYSLA